MIDVIVDGRVVGTDCRTRANLNELEVYVCRWSTHNSPKHTLTPFIHSFIHTFIHSLTHSHFVVSYVRSIDSSKASSPQSEISCFTFLVYVYSLRSPSSCIRHLPLFPAPFIFPSVTCYRRQSQRKL
jgi:hypothetical protein